MPPTLAQKRSFRAEDSDGVDLPGTPKGCPSPGGSEGAAPGAAKRRQLERRNTEEQVRRIISRKLGHLDAHVIKTQTNAKGQTVFMWIRDILKSKKITNGRLSTQAWTQFWREFDLSGDISDRLPRPPDNNDDPIDEELVEGLLAARHANPAERSPVALTRYLETAPKMSEANLYGLLQAVQIGPNLLRSHAMKMQVATLQYFARCGCFCMYTCVCRWPGGNCSGERPSGGYRAPFPLVPPPRLRWCKDPGARGFTLYPPSGPCSCQQAPRGAWV